MAQCPRWGGSRRCTPEPPGRQARSTATGCCTQRRLAPPAMARLARPTCGGHRWSHSSWQPQPHRPRTDTAAPVAWCRWCTRGSNNCTPGRRTVLSVCGYDTAGTVPTRDRGQCGRCGLAAAGPRRKTRTVRRECLRWRGQFGCCIPTIGGHSVARIRKRNHDTVWSPGHRSRCHPSSPCPGRCSRCRLGWGALPSGHTSGHPTLDRSGTAPSLRHTAR
mmetsp:Transcript_14269/g.42261  ORF Transcript_14269/g.42261 Transcript_14269/m.42261 type:complete len:219 (+) Transcript_14269:1274-1930(+)